MEKYNLIMGNIIAIMWIAIICIAFFLGGFFVAVLYFVLEKDDDSTQSIYCFECEIEMPVKEKNGHLYCKNCGLRH